MIIDLIVELAWKSTLAAGAALLLLHLLASRSAAEKSLVAHLAVLALLLLPLAMLSLPEIELAAPPAVGAMLAEAGPIGAVSTSVAAPAAAAPAASFDWQAAALAAYAIPALVMLLIVGIAVARLQHLRARAEVLVHPRWLTALAAAQRRLSFKHGTALLISPELNSPISWGVVRPIIIVDPAAAADTARAEAIIAHELAHVARLDWLKLLMGRVAIALFWFNPLVWALARRCHQYCEEAADDAVLLSEIPGADYADLLVGAARHANGGALLAANGVAPSRHSLAERVAHVLDPARRRAPARIGWAVASIAAALGLNAALAAAEPVVRAPLQAFSASAGEAAAAELAAIDSRHTRALALAIRRADWEARTPGGETRFSEPAAVAPLIAALRDDRPQVRRIAIWGLSEMSHTIGTAAAEPVARLLADRTPAVRAQAARALGDFGAVDRAGAVARLVRDPDPDVRREAAHALGDLQNPTARPALEAALADPNPAVRAKARWALGQIEDAETVLRRYRGG